MAGARWVRIEEGADVTGAQALTTFRSAQVSTDTQRGRLCLTLCSAFRHGQAQLVLDGPCSSGHCTSDVVCLLDPQPRIFSGVNLERKKREEVQRITSDRWRSELLMGKGRT